MRGGDCAGSGYTAGAGGSILLSTWDLAGSGLIDAGGATTTYEPGGGGRVAVYVTKSDGLGSVKMSASGGQQPGNNAAAGTVHVQTKSQANGKGTVLIENAGLASGAGVVTEVPPSITNNPAWTDDLSRVTLVITNRAYAMVRTNLFIRDLAVYTNSFLVLGVCTATVNSVEHHLDNPALRRAGATNLVDHYNQIVWTGYSPGTLLLFR